MRLLSCVMRSTEHMFETQERLVKSLIFIPVTRENCISSFHSHFLKKPTLSETSQFGTFV